MIMKKLTLTILSLILMVATNSNGQNFYDMNTINVIELTFEQSNWDYLLDSLYTDGNENRLTGTAFINGIQYDQVGVRYKGNSSYNPNQIKNPLNIKLDYLINDQVHEGYGTLKLANVYKDPSFVREVLSYEIARQYMPAGQANFSKVFINGTYLGLYTSVQDVDKYFLRNHYYSGNNPFFKGELASGETPTLVTVWGYSGADSAVYHNYYEMESDDGWTDLIGFLDVLNNYPAMVGNVLNVDRHLWMLAFDILLVNLDSPVNFAHNYYLYKDDTGRFNPIIWDLNESFGVFSMLLDGAPINPAGLSELTPFLNATNENYPIIEKILSDPTCKKIYVAHLKTMIDDIFASGWYRARALEIQDIIDTEVQNDPNKFYTHRDFINNIDQSVGSGGPPRPGNQPIIGITELMESRISFLNSVAEFQATMPQIDQVTYSPSTVVANSDVRITANVTGGDVVKLAYRSSVSQAFSKVEMLDDGTHGDGSAGDGIFGVSIPVGANGIQYYVYAENNDAASFSPPRAEYELYTLSVTGHVVINEFLALNDEAVADQDGEYDDWIELYNNSESNISLSGYFLSDDGNDLTQWAFPDTFIAGCSYLTIWADEDEEQRGLHANFKISGSGETLYLVDAEGTIINEVSFGEQADDISTGRYPDGTGSFVTMYPTFGSANQSSMTDVAGNFSPQIPGNFQLEQNYPNPFNPRTTIAFELIMPGPVQLVIFNPLGREVKNLVNAFREAGRHEVIWDGTNNGGQQVSSGLYFYELRTYTGRLHRKMLLLR